MKMWTNVLAMTMAGALVAATAFAQGSGGTNTDMMKSSMTGRDDVKAVQQALKDKGHDPGPVDGVMGPKTQAALRDFQKSSGIRESGRPDNETMAKLGVEGRTSSTGAASPSASPGASSGAGSGAGSDKK